MEMSIGFVGGVYQLNYTANGLGANPALTTPGSLTYKVTIPATFTNEFATAGTNAQGSTGAVFSKSLTATNLDPSTLEFISTAGTVTGTFSAGTKVIDVTSAWTLGSPTAFINSFSDQYTQNPLDPTPIAVPEPSAVLGLAALGLAGVVGRSVSRSLHNKRQ